jgi:deoxyribonuclease V
MWEERIFRHPTSGIRHPEETDMPHYPSRHSWEVTAAEAAEIQNQLRSEVVLSDDFGPVRTVAGVDAGFEDDGNTTRAAVVVLGFPDLEVRERALARRPTTFPYIPGFLSFREIPAVLAALEQLTIIPDLLLCDGMGILHPRRFGIASHLGVITGLPAIGVGKSPFIGRHEPVPDERGAWRPIIDRGQTIGAALRTRAGTKPLYISPGHRISLESAIEYVLRCAPRYRLPETTRQADHLASHEK